MTTSYEAVQPRRTLTAVSADGTRLNVEEYGRADAPTIVLSHGWTCSTLLWAPIVRALASDYRLIAYDQRGHGLSGSSAVRAGYATSMLADDLDAVLETVLHDGERALLVGHSMGGMTIMAAADRLSVRERTAAVLLVSTGGSRLVRTTQVLPPRLSARWLRDVLHRQILVSRLPLGPVTPVAKAALKYGVMGPGSSPEQVASCARMVHACRPRQRAEWGKVLAALDLDAKVPQLSAPTAIVVGTVDKLTPKVHTYRIAAALPDCVGVTELPGRGHMTPLEDATAVEAAIRTMASDHLTGEGTAAEGMADGDVAAAVQEKSA
ncbi:putative hydrolase [Actinacidiphila reveromycinica]|uniref:Putative hydrolase n=1 Tax=Actinacidiphila reveromycinica TaxID=659352 RepID=A0A7U3US92_9ACTN|nr:alpha/beta hydrolase [Streptomyces sp. SN-593]BBA97810.1 putative hydrolase [Streptomyces sp. SN-593]